MVRLDILVREDQKIALIKLPGKIAEHIRRAIDDYIEKFKKDDIGISASKSKGRR